MKATIKMPERVEDNLCAACHGEVDVRRGDDISSVAFCGECRERALTVVAYAELGGEG